MTAPAPLTREALRCKLCCSHGVPLSRWCGWCEDIQTGYGADCIIPGSEPMWLCEHGIGVEPGMGTRS